MEAIPLVITAGILYLSFRLGKLIKEIQMIEKAQPSVCIQKDTGDVVITGSQLVSPKLLDITAHLLADPEYFGKTASVRVVEFTENQPEGKYGAFNIDDGVAMINLQKHFDATVEKLKKDKNIHVKYLSFKTILWFDLLTTLLHEFFHAEVCDASPDACEKAKTDDEVRKQIESDCTGMASATIIDLFRDYDVEPSLMAEEPFFGTRFMQLFINEIKEGNEEWSIRQSIMHEKSYAFYDDKRDEGMTTMRSWMRTIEGADPDHEDKRWDEDPHTMECVEKAAVIVDAPVVEEVIALDSAADLDLVAAIEKDTAAPKTEEFVDDPEGLTAILTKDEPGAVAAAVDVPPWDPATLDPDTAMVMSMDMEEPEDDEEYSGGMGIMSALLPAKPYSELEADPSLGPPAVAPAIPAPEVATPVTIAPAKLWCPVHFELWTSDKNCTHCSICGNALVAEEPVVAVATERDGSELFVKAGCTCGAPHIEGSKFCSNCGTSTVAEAPVVTQAVVAPPQAVLPLFPAPETVLTGQPAAAPAAPQFVQNLRMGLPNINMDQATMRGILAEIYRRMHEHAFTKCGFQLCGGNTGQATGFNPAYAGNILQAISIADIPRADELIIGFDQYNNTTGKVKMNQPVTHGQISGKLTKKDSLPSYAIYINNNGIEQKRVFMVQNPFKANANGYSSTALKAQAGHQISWVWDGADNLGGGRRWIYKTENAHVEWLA